MAKLLRQFRIKGLCGAPVTPFCSNGDLNLDLTKNLVEHFVDHEVPNAFVCGTNGEGNNMTTSERMSVAESWVKEAKGKLSAVIIQVGAGNLRDSQSLAEHAQSIGANGIACVGTTYYKPETMGEYVKYMTEVASAAPQLPFMLYDIDFVTGITLDVNTFFSAAKDDIPNLFGVKHTSPDFISISNTSVDHPDIQVIPGLDELYLQGLAAGIESLILPHYYGHVVNRIRESYKQGDLQGARKDQARLLACGKVRRKYGLSIPGWSKAVLTLLGIDVGQPRLPLSPVSDSVLKNLHTDLVTAGFYDWTQKNYSN